MPERELSEMVARLRTNGFLNSGPVEKAMLSVDRVLFVAKEQQAFSYEDCALSIGNKQTISAPTVVAFMLDKLDIKPGMNILEIGTGSGYNTALLAELVGTKGKVFTVERIDALTTLAKKNIAKVKQYGNTYFHNGDGSCGWEENSPYDRIIVTAAMPELYLKHPLIQQLKPDGKLIAPVGDSLHQDLVLYNNKTKTSENILPVIFVPLIGKYSHPHSGNEVP